MKRKALFLLFLIVGICSAKAQNAKIDSVIALITGTWKWDFYSGGFGGIPPTPAWMNIHIILTQDAQDSMNQTVSYESYLDTTIKSSGRAAVRFDSLPWASKYSLYPDIFAAALGIFPDTFPIDIFPLKDTFLLTHFNIADDFAYGFIRDSFPGIPTGMMAENVTESLRIFPNPAINVINIKIKQSDIREIVLFNELGEKVRSKENLLTREADMDLTGLPSGLYFVRVKAVRGVLVRRVMLE